MNKRLPLLILCMLALMLIVLLSAFNSPQAEQTPTATPNFELSATALVARATLTAQAGGDITSIGTSTPFATGLCNALLYRNLNDVEAQIQNGLGVIIGTSLNLTVEVVLLEETTDCITFTKQETTVTLNIPLNNITDIADENILGDTLNNVFGALLTRSSIDSLPNVSLTVDFFYGNQTRSFVAQWHDARTITDMGLRGEDVITRITLLGVEEK